MPNTAGQRAEGDQHRLPCPAPAGSVWASQDFTSSCWLARSPSPPGPSPLCASLASDANPTSLLLLEIPSPCHPSHTLQHPHLALNSGHTLQSKMPTSPRSRPGAPRRGSGHTDLDKPNGQRLHQIQLGAPGPCFCPGPGRTPHHHFREGWSPPGAGLPGGPSPCSAFPRLPPPLSEHLLVFIWGIRRALQRAPFCEVVGHQCQTLFRVSGDPHKDEMQINSGSAPALRGRCHSPLDRPGPAPLPGPNKDNAFIPSLGPVLTGSLVKHSVL